MTDHGSYLAISGVNRFRYEDVFTDPVNLRELSALLRESPGRLRILLAELRERFGLGSDENAEFDEIDPDDVSALFFRISEIGGTAYPVTGEWSSTFEAEVLKDRSRSIYREK